MEGPVEEQRIGWLSRGSRAPGADEALDIGALARALRRQFWLLVVFGGVGGVAAILAILGSVPTYMAVETVLLDEERGDLLNEVSPLSQAVWSDSAVRTEIEIIKSRVLADEVVEHLDLHEDEDFMNPAIGATETAIGMAMALAKPLEEFLTPEPSTPSRGAGENGADAEAEDPEQAARDYAAFLLRNRLEVSRVGRSFVIDIGYEGRNPERAAAIARAYGEQYVTFQLRSTSRTAADAGAWIQERLEVLEGQSLEAAAAVQAFRREHDLVEVRGDLLTEQQQSEMASELIRAAADTAQARARLDSIEGLADRPGAEIAAMAAPLQDADAREAMQELRAEHMEARRRYRPLVEEYGEDHPQALQLARTMRDLEDAIRDEARRAVEASRMAYEIARSREASLRRDLDSTTETTGEETAVLGRLRQLEAISTTYDEVYRNYLERYELTTQQEGFPIAAVQIISAADVPTGAKSPRKKLMLATGLFLGGLIGGSVGALRELRRQPLRTASEIVKGLGLPCAGLLPADRRRGGAAKALRRRTLLRAKEAVDAFAPPARGGTVLGAARVGRARRSTRFLGDLVDVLRGDGALVAVLETAAADRRLSRALAGREGVDLISPERQDGWEAPRADGAPDAIAQLRRSYDYIVVPLPPLTDMAPEPGHLRSLDSVVLRIPWGEATPAFVAGALDDHPALRDAIATTVLEGANVRKARLYMEPGAYEEQITHARS